MFEQLALVDHPNIVKLHKYWLDASESRARVSPWAGHGVVGHQWVGWLWAPTVGGAREFAASQVIFITEYVSSGSLKQFLKKTKKNHKAMNARVCKWAGVGQGQAGVRMLLGTETVRGTGQGWARRPRPSCLLEPTSWSPSTARPGSAGAHRSCLHSGEGLGLPEHLPAISPIHPASWHP